MIDIRHAEAKALFAQIGAFLKREPVPRCESKVSYSLKLDEYGDQRLARERWKSFGLAIRTCDAFLEELKSYKGLWVGYGDWVKALIDRKNGLVQDLERMQIVGISLDEKEAFGVNAHSLQDFVQTRGFGMDKPLPTPKLASRKQQDLSGANEEVIQCTRCSAYVQIHGTPPATLPGQTGPELLVPLTYCPVCGHPIGRGTSAERVRI